MARRARRREQAMAATVLLVEDERKLRELVRSYLERGGFAVFVGGDGRRGSCGNDINSATSPAIVRAFLRACPAEPKKSSSKVLPSSTMCTLVARLAS